jgi:hypothetical protein
VVECIGQHLFEPDPNNRVIVNEQDLHARFGLNSGLN